MAGDDWYKKYEASQKKKWSPTKLTPEEEQEFRAWMSSTPWFKELSTQVSREVGKDFDSSFFLDRLIGEGADYDYRGAWKAGVGAQRYSHDAGAFHWPSAANGKMLKSPKHETAWMEYFMQEHGVDPNELGLRTVEDALNYSRSSSNPGGTR